MPKVVEALKVKPNGAKKKTPKSATVPKQGEGRGLLYPEILVNGIRIPREKLRVSVAQTIVILGWETESQYAERIKAANPDITEEEWQAKSAACQETGEQDPLKLRLEDRVLKDINGEWVACWNNDRNRPFDETHARKFAQVILNRHWAGFNLVPGEVELVYQGKSPRRTGGKYVEGKWEGETLLEPGGKIVVPNSTPNGETIIIGRTGRVESAQHRLIGLMIAYQLWKKNPEKYAGKWDEEPYIESLVVMGTSEHEKVVRTLDNVKPRSDMDCIYSSEHFRDLTPVERRECSRMLGAATSFLWKRVGAEYGYKRPADSETRSLNRVYQTHDASEEFRENHPKLLECVRHIFEENKERAISVLHLSPGQCAGMLYLMGSCTSNPDDYAHFEGQGRDKPKEKALDWGEFQRAKKFWTDLVANKPEVKLVRDVRRVQVGETEEHPYSGFMFSKKKDSSGSVQERTAVLSKAWATYRESAIFTEEELRLRYNLEYVEDANGLTVVGSYGLLKSEFSNFGGIDLGDQSSEHGDPEDEGDDDTSPADAPPTAAQQEAERAKRVEEIRLKLEAENEERKKAGKPGRGSKLKK